MSIKNVFILDLLFILSISILSGCASTQVYKKILLTDNQQPVTEEQIRILERGDDITGNFQILGKVTVNCNTGISKKSAIKEMKKIASQNGANGIIDIHRGPGCAWRYDAGTHYNGLLVKWTSSDDQTVQLENKFLVSRLPMRNPGSPNEIIVSENHSGYGVPFMDFQWINTLTFKGYYVLPEYSEDDSLLSEKAQLLIQVEPISNSSSTDPLTTMVVGLGRDYEVELKIQIIEKETGKIIKEKKAKGDRFQSWIQMIAESGSDIAIGEAINEAIKDLPSID